MFFFFFLCVLKKNGYKEIWGTGIWRLRCLVYVFELEDILGWGEKQVFLGDWFRRREWDLMENRGKWAKKQLKLADKGDDSVQWWPI